MTSRGCEGPAGGGGSEQEPGGCPSPLSGSTASVRLFRHSGHSRAQGRERTSDVSVSASRPPRAAPLPLGPRASVLALPSPSSRAPALSTPASRRVRAIPLASRSPPFLAHKHPPSTRRPQPGLHASSGALTLSCVELCPRPPARAPPLCFLVRSRRARDRVGRADPAFVLPRAAPVRVHARRLSVREDGARPARKRDSPFARCGADRRRREEDPGGLEHTVEDAGCARALLPLPAPVNGRLGPSGRRCVPEWAVFGTGRALLPLPFGRLSRLRLCRFPCALFSLCARLAGPPAPEGAVAARAGGGESGCDSSFRRNEVGVRLLEGGSRRLVLVRVPRSPAWQSYRELGVRRDGASWC